MSGGWGAKELKNERGVGGQKNGRMSGGLGG